MPSLPIDKQNFPWLSSISRVPLQWSNGQTYQLLLTSMYLRITNSGIQWCVMCNEPVLNMSTAPFLHFVSGTHGWQNFSCLPTKDFFCTSHNITLFPNIGVHVPISDHPLVNTTCNSQTGNRNIDLLTNHYDMSLCDLVDRNLEFVFDVHSNLVYWRHNSKPLWWDLCLTVSSLFFFTRVCEHLSLLVHGKRRNFSVLIVLSIICMLLLCRVLLAAGLDFGALIKLCKTFHVLTPFQLPGDVVAVQTIAARLRMSHDEVPDLSPCNQLPFTRCSRAAYLQYAWYVHQRWSNECYRPRAACRLTCWSTRGPTNQPP